MAKILKVLAIIWWGLCALGVLSVMILALAEEEFLLFLTGVLVCAASAIPGVFLYAFGEVVDYLQSIDVQARGIRRILEGRANPHAAVMGAAPYTPPVAKPVTRTADGGWKCGKCGEINGISDVYCKSCGEYK